MPKCETDEWAYIRFRGAPLAADQKIILNPDGSREITATVVETKQLVNLLQELAHRVFVIDPAPLRKQIESFLDEANALRMRMVGPLM